MTSLTGPPLASGLINLNHPAYVVHWGFVQITLANAIVILLMIAVFVLAIVVPFRRGGRGR